MENNENKKDNGFGKGLTLIIIGVIFTFVTLFDFEIDWHVMAKMWPLLLIIIGVCIMPINKWIRAVIALILLAFGTVMYHQKAGDEDGCTKVNNRVEYRMHKHSYSDWDDDDD